MVDDAQAMVGRFYKFRPRSQWPSHTRNSIPVDKMYESHPVIVVSVTKAGALNIVMVTSNPINPISNYVPIGFESDRVSVRPLTLSKALPKQTWVQINSKRTYPKELFTTFEDVSLSKRSKTRLFDLVSQAEIGRSQEALASKSFAAQPKSMTTSLATKSAPALGLEINHSSIQDIKTSLAELTHAITALAAVCNKLEGGTTPSSPAAQLLSKVGTKTSCMSTEMSGALPIMVIKLGVVATLNDAASVQSKRSSLRKWLWGAFKTKQTIALSI